jgi:hypothetical protein
MIHDAATAADLWTGYIAGTPGFQVEVCVFCGLGLVPETAFPIRNQEMLDSEADPVIASIVGRGTLDMINSAESADVTAEPLEAELAKTQCASSHSRQSRLRCLICEMVERNRTSTSVEAIVFMEAEDNLSSPGLSPSQTNMRVPHLGRGDALLICPVLEQPAEW